MYIRFKKHLPLAFKFYFYIMNIGFRQIIIILFIVVCFFCDVSKISKKIIEIGIKTKKYFKIIYNQEKKI